MNQGTIKGHVNAGCLLFIPDSFTDLQKKDLVDCILYTQLAATKKHSRLDDPEGWRHTWVAALSRFGWPLLNHEQFSLPGDNFPTDTLWGWLKTHRPPFVPLELIDPMEKIVQGSVSGHPHQPAFKRLMRQVILPPEKASSVVHHVRLLLAGYHPSAGLCLIVLSFQTCQAVDDDLLTAVLDPGAIQGNVELTFYKVQMNDLLYGQYRDSIDQALTDRRADAISSLREAGDVPSQ